MRNIQGSDRVCGVMGDPIQHTLSPFIHNTLAEAMNIPMVYVPFQVGEAQLEVALKGAHALGIRGLNVTMPHKKEVIRYTVGIDKKAELAQAVNTLVYTPEGYRGYNTDIGGLSRAMATNGIDCTGKKVAVIGSGGAAYAACLAVIDQAQAIYIYNRTREKAHRLKAHLEQVYKVPITVGSPDACEPVDIVIQTTRVGMGALEGQMPIAAEALLAHAKVAIDILYKPWETPFLKAAKANGLQTMNGFQMLYYQAVEAFELTQGCVLDKATEEAIKEKLLREL